jgi:chromosome condensin MukBEF MukE localization factor
VRLTSSHAQRGKKDKKHEDFLTNLRRLTLVHEMSGNEEVFRFQEGSVLHLAATSDTGTNLESIDNN